MSILDRAIALCEKDADTYRVGLPGGDEVEFRHVSGPDDVSRLETRAAEIVETIRKGTAGKDIMGQKVKDPVTVMQAFFLKSLYVNSWRIQEPDANGAVDFKQEPDAPTFADWLNMAAKVPFAFRTLWSRVDDEITGRAALARREAVEAAKKGFAATEHGSPNSKPVETPGANTLASCVDNPMTGT